MRRRGPYTPRHGTKTEILIELLRTYSGGGEMEASLLGDISGFGRSVCTLLRPAVKRGTVIRRKRGSVFVYALTTPPLLDNSPDDKLLTPVQVTVPAESQESLWRPGLINSVFTLAGA